MATKTFKTKIGDITVRNAMFEERDGTSLYEGIELKDEFDNIIEVPGYRDVEGMEIEDVEEILSKMI
jgi:hypothetical protein